jgi:hypothetical protein
MTRTDRLANAIVAVGGPDKRCPSCGTNAYALARLTLEVIDQLGDDEMALAGAHLTAVRGERYGSPVDNFGRIWHLWQPILEAEHLTGEERVGLMMLAVKLARLIQTPDDEDGLIDLAGYAATMQILAGREPTV